MIIRSRWFTSVYSSRFRVLTVPQLDSCAPPGWASVTVLNERVVVLRARGIAGCASDFWPSSPLLSSHPVELGLTKPFRRKHKSAVGHDRLMAQFFFLPSEPFPIGRKRLGGWANLGLCYIPCRRRFSFSFFFSILTATWTWRLGGWAILGLVFFFFLSKVAVAQDTDT